MATVKHRLEYWAAVFGFSIANLLSAKSANSFGKFLGKFFSRILPKRKIIAIDNLRHAFKDSKTDEEYEKIAIESFENIGQTFIELARFKKISHSNLQSMVSCSDLSAFQKAHDEQNGAIIVTSHFGNWEMAAAWVVAMGYDIDCVVKVQSNHLVDNLITQLRKRLQIGIIPVKTSTLRDILKSLKNNKFVAIVADQHDPSGNLILNFFGREASVAKGPAAFAKKQNCPIIPAVMRRVEFDTFEIITAPGIYPSDSVDENEDMIRMTKKYLLFFEDVIRKYPGQWMWTHRRWKINVDNEQLF